MTILVTGATGKIGRNLTRLLLEHGHEVRATTRDPDLAVSSGDVPAGVDVRRGDMTDPDSIAAAADGAEAALLLMPFATDEHAERTAPLVVKALGERVPRVAHISSNTAPAGTFWARMEDYVRADVQDWTMLQPVGFAGNTFMWRDQIRSGDTVRWIYGDVARPLIDEYDIADVARVALTSPGHAGVSYVLSGPAMVSNREQVHEIGRALGRELRWEELDLDTARQEIGAAFGNPGGIDGMLEAWRSFGENPEPITDTVERLTGRPARTFAQWAEANADRFG